MLEPHFDRVGQTCLKPIQLPEERVANLKPGQIFLDGAAGASGGILQQIRKDVVLQKRGFVEKECRKGGRFVLLVVSLWQSFNAGLGST